MTKRTTNKTLILINVIVSILFLLPALKLDLFTENYSTLSLTARGYLYVLILGITIGLLLWYEANIVSKKKYNVLFLIALFIGTVVPHHVPYNLQGNLHLLFAYVGFAGLIIMTLINCGIKKYRDSYLLFIFSAVIIYLKYGMVNTLSEIIVMISTLYINLLIVLKKKI